MNKESRNMLYKCSKCDYRSTIGQLILHRRRHQKENIEEYIQSNSVSVREQKDKPTSSDKDILYKCFVCNLICTSPGALIFHERTHRKIHKCSSCKYSCTTYAELEIHVKSHRSDYDSSLKENNSFCRELPKNFVSESAERKIQLTNSYSSSDTTSQKNPPHIIKINSSKEPVEQVDRTIDIRRNETVLSSIQTDNLTPTNINDKDPESFFGSGNESDPCVFSEDFMSHSPDYISEAVETGIPEYRNETADLSEYITTKPNIHPSTLLMSDPPNSKSNYEENIKMQQFPNASFYKAYPLHQDQYTTKNENIEIPRENNQIKHSYENCILCKPNKLSTRERVEVKTIKGRKALYNGSKLRNDNLYDDLKTASPLYVHIDCRWDYVKLEKLNKSHKSIKGSKNGVIDNSGELFDFHTLCLYCGLTAEIKNPQSNNLSMNRKVAFVDNLEFQEEANEIYDKYSCIDQPTKKSLRRMKNVCLLNERARYHIKCYDAFVNHVIETSCFQKAFRKLCKYIDSNEKGLYKLSSLKRFMTKCSPLSVKNINSLKLNLASYYGKRMVIIQCENEELVTFNKKCNKRHNKLSKIKRIRRNIFGSFIRLDIESVDSVCSFIKTTEQKIINTSASSRSLPSLHFTSQLPNRCDTSGSLIKSTEFTERKKKLNELVKLNKNTSLDSALKEVRNNSQLISLNIHNEEFYQINAENFLSTNLLQKLEKGLCNLNESVSSSSTEGDVNISAISVYDTVQDNSVSLETDINNSTSPGHITLDSQHNDCVGLSEISPLQRKPSLKEKLLNKIWRRDKVSSTESSGCGNKRKSIIANEVNDIENKMSNATNHSINVENLMLESHMQGTPNILVDVGYRNKVISVPQNISSEGVYSVRPKLSTSPDNNKLFDDASEIRATILLNHTNEKSVNTYECRTCHELLKKGNVMSHLKMHKKDFHIECDICSKNFFTQLSHFEKHYLWHMEQKTYECELCKKCFPSNKSLKGHMKLHTKQKSYTCKLCSLEFTRESCLIRHQESHKNEKFKCFICCKMFNSESSLDFHMKLHSTKKSSDPKVENNLTCSKVPIYQNDPEECSEAKKSMDLKPDPSEKSFKCEECFKVFSQQSHFETHMLRHSKEKHHQCDKCDKRFRSKKERTLHMKLHAVHKVFVCNVCSAEFTRRSSLQCHERGHLE